MSKHDSNDGKSSTSTSRRWAHRFGYALRGVRVAITRESNFWVYALVSAAVAAAGAWVGISTERWCLLVLCMGFVVVAELFNSAIEHLARAITREVHPEIRDALDVASGAVLLAAIGSAIAGLIVVGPPLVSALL